MPVSMLIMKKAGELWVLIATHSMVITLSIGKVTMYKGITHAGRKKSVLMRQDANLVTEMIN